MPDLETGLPSETDEGSAPLRGARSHAVSASHQHAESGQPNVGLFVTCLVDLMRPSVGFAAAALLEASGCRVGVPTAQTCCGQPAYNSGDRNTARDLARATIAAFADFDYVVAPSGSCAAMLKVYFPKLFPPDDPWHQRANAFAENVHELVSFLVDVRGIACVSASYSGRVVYHDACSARRELGIEQAPRLLLKTVAGLELVEASAKEDCCGFGGLFSVKYPEISSEIARKKVVGLLSEDPDLIVGPDLGCLISIAGTLSRSGRKTACRHIAEVLAGHCGRAPIGKPQDDQGG